LRASAVGEGFALLRALRRRPMLRDLPVIALTEGEVDAAQLSQLRETVRTIVPAEAAGQALVRELQRVAPAAPGTEPGGKPGSKEVR
jgi:CheY-like chemotaxis protein